MATIEKSVDTMVNKLTKRSVVFNKKLAKITKPKKGSRKTKGKWDEFDEKLWDMQVNYRQLKQTALFLTEGVKQVVETIGLFTVALEAILIAPTKSACEANPQDWHTNSDCDFRLPLEIWWQCGHS